MPSMSNRQKRFCCIIAFTSLGLIWSFRLFGPERQTVTSTVIPYAKAAYSHVVPQQSIQSVDLSHLKKYVKTDDFTYARRFIKTKYFVGERPTTTNAQETLLGEPQRISMDELVNIPIEDRDIIRLRVPKSPDVDQSIMSFAIATKADRLDRSLQLLHWLPKSGAQLHVMSPPAVEAFEVEEKLQKEGINVTIHDSNLPFAKAYFYGIKQLYETRTDNTKWIVLMDDDTFLPSLPHLVEHFNTNYDASKEVMVAAVSDNLDQVRAFGMIPFGGGGIFLSVPLAASLVQDHVWNRCMETQHDQGDGIVNECLNAYSPTRPTFDLGLNQMDFNGDPSGYFESGRRMLTVHHWKTWYHVDIPMAANVSKACGFECLFQRFRFNDNFILSNGYSIAEYPSGLEGQDGEVLVDLDQVEMTWVGAKANYEHHIGPLRRPFEKHEKKQLLLREATTILGKGVRQTYVENSEASDDVENELRMDRVVELIWLFD